MLIYMLIMLKNTKYTKFHQGIDKNCCYIIIFTVRIGNLRILWLFFCFQEQYLVFMGHKCKKLSPSSHISTDKLKKRKK